MKKTWFVLFVAVFCTTAVFAGGKKENAADVETHASEKLVDATAKVVLPGGAPLVCTAKMITEKLPALKTIQTDYEIVAPDTLQARVIAGEADIAIVPSNLAANLYAKGADVQYAGTVVWGILYGVSTEPVKDIADLKGKTILTFGRGLTPDITVRHLLSASGINPDTDVTFTYVQSAQEAAGVFMSGKETIAVLPEPLVSVVLTKKPEAAVFLDIQQAWKEKFGGESGYPQAAVIVKGAFAKEYPHYVRTFLQSLADSITWAKNNPEEAAKAAASLQEGVPAPVLAKGIARMNVQFVDAVQSRSALEQYYSVLLQANQKFSGGSLPNDAFYYTPAQ
ncbi:MAG: ABC transporter substrate-binding protein [Treponema sp.]